MKSLPIGKRARAVVALLLVAGLAASADAGTVTFASNQGASSSSLGTYEGSMEYTYDASTSIGSLVVKLENTSPVSNGGYLTAFAFNVDGFSIMWLGGTSSNVSNFGTLYLPKASPFGYFDLGAGIKSKWDGGKPSTGVAVGDTATFTFKAVGFDASKFTTDDFFEDSSVKGNKSAVFLARFRGFDDGGSDKVPGELTTIPLPLAAWAGLGLLGMLGLRRKMRR